MFYKKTQKKSRILVTIFFLLAISFSFGVIIGKNAIIDKDEQKEKREINSSAPGRLSFDESIMENKVINVDINQTWGGTGDDVGNDIFMDDNGNIYLTGETWSYGSGASDVFVLKCDKSGTIFWESYWGGSDMEKGNSITLDPSGNIYVTGYTWSFSNGQADVFLLKMDLNGNVIWYTTWGGSREDIGFSLALGGSGNIYLTGHTKSYGTTNEDIILMKYDPNGNLLWNLTYTIPDSSTGKGYDIKVDIDENIYISGGGSYFILKFDSEGNLLWATEWSGWTNDIIIDNNNNVIYATGATWTYGNGESDVCIAKFDLDGRLLWEWTWGGPGIEYTHGITMDNNENIYITGETWSYGSGWFDMFLLKFDSEGNLIWNFVWGSALTERGSKICIDSWGDLYIVGTLECLGIQKSELMFLKVSYSDGDIKLGDVNGDGYVDIVDAMQVAQYAAGFNIPNFNPDLADVNYDGSINIVDALMIAEYYIN